MSRNGLASQDKPLGPAGQQFWWEIRQRRADPNRTINCRRASSVEDDLEQTRRALTPKILHDTFTVHRPRRRRSFSCMRSLVKSDIKPTLLHDLRLFFDASYRLDLVQVRLKEIMEQQKLLPSDLFARIDNDHSNKVDVEELAAMVHELQVPMKKIDVEHLMERVNRNNGRNHCSLQEFTDWLKRYVRIRASSRRSGDQFSDTNLLRRESLKFHPLLRRRLRELWKLTDANGNGNLDCEEYVLLHMNLQRAIVPPNAKRFDEKRGRKLALAEWEFDVQGEACMDEHLFILSMFQMADAWRTGPIHADAYMEFMNWLDGRMMSTDESGK